MSAHLEIIGYGTFTLACLVVGVRLLWLWRKSRQLPELLFGLSFFLGFVGQPLSLLGGFPGLGDFPLAAVLVQRAIYVGGFACVTLVVWRVFRPDSVGARILTAVLLTQHLTYTLRDFLLGPVELGQLVHHPLYWWDSCGQMVPYIWAAWESLKLQRALRRRYRVGIERSRILADRMLLWGLGFGSMAILYSFWEIELLWIMLSGAELVLKSHPLWTLFLGMTCASCFWLAFLPPRAYLRWARRCDSLDRDGKRSATRPA